MHMLSLILMTTRSFSFVPGEFYHLYNRGVDKRVTFTTPYEYKTFQELLFLANGDKPIDRREIRRQNVCIYDWDRGEPLVAIGVYCLMPNHYHLLVTPLKENGVSQFMNRLGTSYSMYFNKIHDRSGALFQGKFKATMVDSDEYLKYLYSYIHLNPVKLIQSDWKEKGIRDVMRAYEYATSYKFSSLGSYVSGSFDTTLSPSNFPNYFPRTASHKEQLMEWLNYGEI